MQTTTTSTPITTQSTPKTSPLSFVSPSELCDTQRRNMAADAFAALASFGL